MEIIKIVYIDDEPEPALSEYLDIYSKEFENDKKITIEKEDVVFDSAWGYEQLIQNEVVTQANIIIIDSRLFEFSKNGNKFSGEDFKIILKKIFPFIEVIVISQNEISQGYQTIKKYKKNNKQTPIEYYNQNIPQVLDKAVSSVIEARQIVERMSKSENVEKVLVEKLENLLEGHNEYNEFTKTDIDELITAFREIQEKYE